MRAGESGGAVYLIVSGRLLVLGSPEPNPDTATIPESEVLAELGKGDTVGETSLMTGDPRTATVVALRDSLVAALDQQAFKQLIQAFPLEMMSILTRQLNRRSQESQAHRRHDRPPASIAILPLAPESNASAFTARLQQALSTFGEVLSVSRETPLVRNSTAASETRLVEWLNDQENSFRHVLYQAEPAATRWTLRSIRQADRIYLLANAADDPSASALRLKDILHSELRATGAHQPAKHYHLILLHPSGDTRAAGTELWRAAFPMVTEHHHVRLDHDADFARLARSINQRLVGLALGGGFALGIAHIGIIRAMRELNIPIDQVGGTSMGSVVAAACAMHFDYEQMLDVIVVGCANSLKRDYTFPVLSLLTGAKMARVLGVHLGNLRVEDFWLPYFSISASLRHASMVVHTQGNALRSVLASSRAPVMFPPLQWGDDLLVDGGLVNNIPADVMRSLTPGGTVFAVDVSRSEEIPRPTGENLSVSGWKQLLGRFAPRSKRQPTVNMLDVLGRIIRLGGVSRAQLIRADADCYLAPPLTGFKALDFAQGRQIAEASYEWALQALGSWLHQNGRPWESSEINPSTLQDSPPHQSAEA
jgi:predicted acylesterase/phospholipase RssA/CRP-like cAMP-binding protein